MLDFMGPDLKYFLGPSGLRLVELLAQLVQLFSLDLGLFPQDRSSS